MKPLEIGQRVKVYGGSKYCNSLYSGEVGIVNALLEDGLVSVKLENNLLQLFHPKQLRAIKKKEKFSSIDGEKYYSLDWTYNYSLLLTRDFERLRSNYPNSTILELIAIKKHLP